MEEASEVADSYRIYRMYRKYSLKRTHVINSHNYLLEAEQADGSQCLFHQILVSANSLPSLPSLKDRAAIEQLIGESENQNSINETSGTFEFYLEQNLLQIRLKPGVKPISEIGKLPIRQVLALLNTLNLDLVISIKQMRSMARHNQIAYSNANKFFSQLVLKAKNFQLILPFIDGDQIHFYDVYYQEAFCKNREKEKQKRTDDCAFKKRLSEKRIKRKSQASNEDHVNNDEIIFQKYLYFLVLLFSTKNTVQYIEEVQKLGQQSLESALKKIEKIQNSTSEKTEKLLMQLLHRCIANEGEYSLNIFVKQCQILIDKHDKMQRGAPSEKRIDEPKPSREDKVKNSKSCLAINKQLRKELLSSHHQASRQSEKRLKGSKSLINLKVNKSGPSSKSRNLKNGSGIFSKSKEKLLDKTNLFQQSWSSFTQSKSNNTFSVNQPSSLGSMAGSASSNWFNQSASSNQSIIKLRNFKKSNNFTGTASQTPSHHQFRSQASANLASHAQENEAVQQVEKVSESQLNRLSKLIRRQSVAKAEKANLRQDNKFTMTQHFEEAKREEIKEQKQIELKQQKPVEPKEQKIVKPVVKREIINTINFKFYEETKKTIELQKKQDSKFKIIEQQTIMKAKPINKTEQKQEIPKMHLQKSMIAPKQQASKVTPIETMKHKKPQTIKNSVFNSQQFQEITLTKKQVPKAISNASSLIKKTNIGQKQAEPVKVIVQNELKSPQLRQKIQKIKITIKAIPEDQKGLYIKQHVFLLKFYKQNCVKQSKLKQSKLGMLPQLNNIYFVVYFLYYKANLQYQNAGNSNYKELLDMLSKKQQKIAEADKNACLLYRVSYESLLAKVKAIRSIESNLAKGIQEQALKQKIFQSRQQIQEFYKLTCQSNRLLELIYRQITAFVLANKIILIQKDAFLAALQLLYLITLLMIISIQRQNYYALMLQEKFTEMQDCFRFRYEKNEEEYFTQYKNKIQNIDKVSLSVQEECAFFQRQYQKYK